MSAKDDILKQINKKAQKYAELKEESLGKFNPGRLVAAFIDAVERAKIDTASGIEFSSRVEQSWSTLEHRLHRIDAGAFAQVVWHKEDQCEDWKDLRPVGVKIVWSEKWQKQNPDKDREMFIGVEQLFLGDID